MELKDFDLKDYVRQTQLLILSSELRKIRNSCVSNRTAKEKVSEISKNIQVLAGLLSNMGFPFDD